jgi:hypothetical protein
MFSYNGGQVTVEFILILTIMLAILSIMSLPLSEEARHDVEGASRAANLAAVATKLKSTAAEVSMMGCESYKDLIVYLDEDIDAEVSLDLGVTEEYKITGSFEYKRNPDEPPVTTSLKDTYAFPSSITFDPNTLSGGFTTVRVSKNC